MQVTVRQSDYLCVNGHVIQANWYDSTWSYGEFPVYARNGEMAFWQSAADKLPESLKIRVRLLMPDNTPKHFINEIAWELCFAEALDRPADGSVWQYGPYCPVCGANEVHFTRRYGVHEVELRELAHTRWDAFSDSEKDTIIQRYIQAKGYLTEDGNYRYPPLPSYAHIRVRDATCVNGHSASKYVSIKHLGYGYKSFFARDGSLGYWQSDTQEEIEARLHKLMPSDTPLSVSRIIALKICDVEVVDLAPDGSTWKLFRCCPKCGGELRMDYPFKRDEMEQIPVYEITQHRWDAYTDTEKDAILQRYIRERD